MTSNRIGRNERCPCGSGKKFKKCCISNYDQKLKRSDDILEGGKVDRIAGMRAIIKETSNHCRERFDWVNAKHDAEKIRIAIEEIESSARKLLSIPYHSKRYWYILIRRYTWLLWDEYKQETDKSSSKSKYEISVRAGKLILLSTDDEEPFELVETNGTSGINYKEIGRPEMEAAAKIFSLAALLYDMEIRYRFACKGFSVFSPSLDSDILSKQDTTSIVNYEKRRSKFGTFSGSAGLWCDSSIVSPLNPGICGWFGSTPFKTDSLSFQSKRPTSNIQLQYFFGFVYERSSSEGNDNKMIPYDRLLLDDCLSIAFEEGFSIEPVKVVAFLYCITAFISWVIQIERLTYSDSKIKIDWKNIEMSFRDKVIHHWNDVATLGMLRSSKKSWLDALVMHTANINKNISSIPKLDRSTLSNILDIYTWTQGDSVDDNNPRLFIKLSKDMLVLDTAWMADFLRLLLLRAGIASRESKRMGEVSGPWLECQAKSFFIRELDLENKSVVFRRIVKNKEGMEDIDIAFVVGRTLFVIDCKAMAKTADYMVGHHSILRNRKSEQLKQLIERNPARVKKIKEGLVKDKINPKEFDKSYGLVCTSDVEYLPMGEKEFWVDGFPLVAPPEELLGTIRYLHKLTNQ